MRSTFLLLTCLGTALASVGVAHADSIGGAYYNPANSASTTGMTIGKDLYKTIGCPGRALLDPVCAEDAPAPVVAAIVPVPQEAPVLAPVAPVPVPEPIAVVQPTPPAEPVAEVKSQPAAPVEPVVVAKNQPVAPADEAKTEECYSKFIKSATESFRDAANNWIKARDVAYGKAM